MYLVVTRSYPPEVGGMQNLMWGLTKELSKYNLIKVFADYNEGCEKFDNEVSFSIERIKGIKLIKKYRKALLVNNLLKNNKKVQCIIADHWKSLELIKSDVKKICLIHSKEINHSRGTRLNKRVLSALNNAHTIVSNSNYTKSLAADVGVDPKKIIVINPGVDEAKDVDKKFINDAQKLLNNKSPRLITVSRYDKRKNHEKIIMALRNLKQIYPQIIYTSIGYGEEEENIKRLVKELKLEENVLFLKNISQNLKNALMSVSNVFVMPSVIYKKSVEGFGISYIEAAQYGVPSIGGKDGGAADAILHKKTGLICDGNSLDEIYSSLQEILSENKFKEYGKEAKNFAEGFTWNKIVKHYNSIIN